MTIKMNNNITIRKRNTLIAVSFVVSVFLPLIPLYIFRYFYVDYGNNLWMIQYFIRYFKLYHSFPLVINTADGISGMTNPMYYGYIYYPIMSIIGILLHGARRAVIFVITIQNVMLFIIYQNIFDRLFRKFVGTVFWSCGLTTIMMWNTYLITKLYSDGARTEYTAVLCLYLALGAWILSCMSTKIVHQICLWMFMAWNIMFMVGSHPITAEIGGTILLLIILCSIPYVLKNNRHKYFSILFGCVLAILIVLTVLPWLYIVINNSQNTSIYTDKILWNSPEGIHGLLYRLALFPYSDRSLWGGTGIISPYLCLQINMPLFGIYAILSIVLFIKRKTISKNRIVICTWVLILSSIMYLFSSCSWIVGITEKIFPSIQFEYRLITYVDLLMLVGTVITLTTLIPTRVSLRTQKMIAIIVSFAVILSAHDVIIQLHYAYAMKDMYQPDVSSVSAPQSFYWRNDYADPSVNVLEDQYDNYPSLNINFDADEDRLNLSGKSIDFQITDDESVVIRTNISASKYNHIYIDDKEATSDQLFRNSDENYTYACIVTGKGTHTITYCTSVDDFYEILRIISYLSLILISIMYGASITIIAIRSYQCICKQISLNHNN